MAQYAQRYYQRLNSRDDSVDNNVLAREECLAATWLLRRECRIVCSLLCVALRASLADESFQLFWRCSSAARISAVCCCVGPLGLIFINMGEWSDIELRVGQIPTIPPRDCSSGEMYDQNLREKLMWAWSKKTRIREGVVGYFLP